MIAIPDFSVCEKAMLTDNGSKASALHHFVYIHEPQEDHEAENFRRLLQMVLENERAVGTALAQQDAVAPDDGWRPMSECPKDPKQSYDLWTRTCFRMPDCRWSDHLGFWILANGKMATDNDFTHWRLPPSNPAVESA